MDRFEYQTLPWPTMPHEHGLRLLNNLGADGWEVVAFASTIKGDSYSSDTDFSELLLKRRLT